MTVYANLVGNEVQGVYDLLPPTWNSITNFREQALASENFMRKNGFVKIVRDTTPFNADKQKMSDFPWYSVKDGNVYEHRDILDIPPAAEPETTPSA